MDNNTTHASEAQFSHPEGNFIVQSQDGAEFRVNRAALESGSDIFRDMFALCDVAQEQRLVLPEPAQALSVLLRLLHEPPSQDDPAAHPIPLPLLPALFTLADKYALSDQLAGALQAHLIAHAPTMPLRVYALAVQLGLPRLASAASAHLLATPLHEHSADEVAQIPSVRAYHALVVLHAHRVARLRETVLAEELFPKDYGLCTAHGQATRDLWTRKAHFVWGQLGAGTDVAAEMSSVLSADPIRGCEMCRMGCVRSIEMLRVGRGVYSAHIGGVLNMCEVQVLQDRAHDRETSAGNEPGEF